MRLVAVAVPVPFLDLLTYNVPDRLELPAIGARVRVPLGSRTLTGCVIEHGASIDAGTTAKDIVDVLDTDPFLPATVVALARWVAEYYVAGVGDAIAVAMPPGAARRASSYKTQRIVSITAHGLSTAGSTVRLKPDTATDTVRLKPDTTTDTVRLKPDTTTDTVRLKPDTTTDMVQLKPDTTTDQTEVVSGFSRTVTAIVTTIDDAASEVVSGFSRTVTPKQRSALEVLAAAPAGLPISALRERGVTPDVVSRLVKNGLATIRDEADERDPFERSAMATVVADPDRQLTSEQAVALDALSARADAGEFRVALLHGVTGSGKTEIYLRLAARVCKAGRQVLLMVPEIALTPSVAALFRAAFGTRVAIQHSALSDGERHDQWQRIRRGDIDIVVGTRSAVFAPLPSVGLIIVDEEHDTSYKQEESPRYNGRDVAIVRGSLEKALVVLGSATPSLESFQNAATGKYDLVSLERRVLDRPMATVRIVNMRDEYATQGPDVVISGELITAIDERLLRQEQVLVLLNRRGYSTAVFCRQCGDTYECPNCSVSLTVHRARNGWRARCHYCNYATDVPKSCRKCAAPYLEHTGFGTEKVEQHLRDRFPDARIGRVDRDSVRRKGALTSLLSKFAAGELDVLVGTQMIAKGHDFPRVTLVGVISADVGLGLADFRAGERTFQLLTQVAGRAGRGERKGEAIVQTLYPEHYSIQLACQQDYAAFFEQEFLYRKGMRYPPLVALINIVVRGPSLGDAMHSGAEIVRRLEGITGQAGMMTLGPAPAPLGRLRGEHRVQVFIKGTRRAEMRQAVKRVLAEMPEIRRKVTVDIDPLSVL